MYYYEDSRNIDQVFLYITGVCNAKCTTCYLGKKYHSLGHISLADLIKRAMHYYLRGARKITLLGGEATLHPQFNNLLIKLHEIGYEFIRVTTNGMFSNELFSLSAISYVNTFAFSIDGYKEELNRKIRPGTELAVVLANMDLAYENGFEVRINSTVTSDNIDYLRVLIELATRHHVSQINLNLIFLEGNAKDANNLLVLPMKWRSQFQNMEKWSKKYRVQIKTPYGFTNVNDICMDNSKKELIRKIKHRAYCLIDGQEYNCLLFIERKGACQESMPYCQYLSETTNQNAYCLDYKVRFS